MGYIKLSLARVLRRALRSAALDCNRLASPRGVNVGAWRANAKNRDVTATKGSIFFALMLASLIAASNSCAAFTKGDDAYTAGDYKAAAQLWSNEAAAGSREAKFRLGLLSELGLGLPMDEHAAFTYYLEAAKLGQPEAAFSVGGMLDTGTGVAQDPVSAGYWYARAALGGEIHAAFSLGLLYQSGTGVEKNLQLAAFWLEDAAKTSPAARKALLANPLPSLGKLTAPTPVGAGIFKQDGKPFADLVWTVQAGPKGHIFAVQFYTSDRSFQTTQTSASAIRLALPDGPVLWRVAQIDPAKGSYAASPWQRQIADPQLDAPVGLITILVNSGDSRAKTAAQQMKEMLKPSGLSIAVQTAKEAAKQSSIQYRYQEDAALAAELAKSLPGFTHISASQSGSLGSGPEEIVVKLVLTTPQSVNR